MQLQYVKVLLSVVVFMQAILNRTLKSIFLIISYVPVDLTRQVPGEAAANSVSSDVRDMLILFDQSASTMLNNDNGNFSSSEMPSKLGNVLNILYVWA